MLRIKGSFSGNGFGLGSASTPSLLLESANALESFLLSSFSDVESNLFGLFFLGPGIVFGLFFHGHGIVSADLFFLVLVVFFIFLFSIAYIDESVISRRSVIVLIRPSVVSITFIIILFKKIICLAFPIGHLRSSHYLSSDLSKHSFCLEI